MWFTLKISSSFIFGLIKNIASCCWPPFIAPFLSSIFYHKTVILHKIAFCFKLHHKCRIWLFHDFPIERQQNRITSVEKWHQNLNKKPECDPHNLMEKPEAAEKWSLYVHFLQHNGHKKNSCSVCLFYINIFSRFSLRNPQSFRPPAQFFKRFSVQAWFFKSITLVFYWPKLLNGINTYKYITITGFSIFRELYTSV